MIINLTHQEDGTPIQRLAVSAKVSIGLPSGSGAGTTGTNYPKKLDHFRITAKLDSTGEWTDDSPFYERLRELYMPIIKTDQGEKRAPLREFDIVFLSDKIDDVLRTELAWWGAAEKKCSGDGRTAQRSILALTPEQKAQNTSGARTVPWQPCGDTCKDMIEGRCKPSGSLYFIFKDRPIMGSVVYFHTTSYETIRRIHSSLLQIHSVTGGRLRGIPLKMVLRPGKTRFEESGKIKTSMAYFVNIEFRQDDYLSLVPKLLEQSVQYEQSVALASKGQRLIASHVDEDEDAIEVIPDAQLATAMTAEFYPQNQTETVVHPETGVQGSPVTHPYLNAAQLSALTASLNNDMVAAQRWLTEFNREIERLKATGPQIQECFGRAIAPGGLEALKQVAALTPTPAERQRASKKAAGAATPTPPAQPEAPAPSQSEQPAADKTTWGF